MMPPAQPLIDCIAANLSNQVEINVNGRLTKTTMANAIALKTLNDFMLASLKDKMAALKSFDLLGILSRECTNIDESYDAPYTEEHRRLLEIIMGDDP